ncbi:DUF5361 domain-containing protein [Kocuria rosea]|uniref:DUF5361 domain-containing protein n=1 Tax=Kocuria rosea TaxID=1275 RepID=UPI003D356DBA
MGTPELTWHDLRVFVSQIRFDTSSACRRDIEGEEESLWGLEAMLLAEAVDALNWLRWAKTDAAKSRGARPPAPIPRPGVESKKATTETESMAADEVLDFLGPEFAHLVDVPQEIEK